MATARTCYAPRVITPDDVAKDESARAQRDRIARSTYQAGHHTTLQHAHFQFALENVSRQFLWSFLHAHPFYNSEQVSQRYVAVKPDRVLVPKLSPEHDALYRDTVLAQMQCYQKLVAKLSVPVADEYFRIFPARRKEEAAHASAIQKRAQEIARYALPVATFAHLYHTVSGITLHRYHRLSAMLDVPEETRVVVAEMVRTVTAVDPLFFREVEDVVPLERTVEYEALAALGGRPLGVASAFVREFDAVLGERTSKLVAYSSEGETLLAQGVRTVLGISKAELPDALAIAWALSPAKNTTLSGALNLTSLSKLGRTLVHAHYTFQKKLSHTADSQDQRHRLVPASRPVLYTQYIGGTPDVVVPKLLRQCSEGLDLFMATMTRTWKAIDTLLDEGVSFEHALYLLPNAFPIRFLESGDLSGLHHKWTTRLCYNAQEEIWQASVEEVQDVRRVHPEIGRYLEPPCGLRREAKLRPLCPEGDHYCGVPVWKLDVSQYERLI